MVTPDARWSNRVQFNRLKPSGLAQWWVTSISTWKVVVAHPGCTAAMDSKFWGASSSSEEHSSDESDVEDVPKVAAPYVPLCFLFVLILKCSGCSLRLATPDAR